MCDYCAELQSQIRDFRPKGFSPARLARFFSRTQSLASHAFTEAFFFPAGVSTSVSTIVDENPMAPVEGAQTLGDSVKLSRCSDNPFIALEGEQHHMSGAR